MSVELNDSPHFEAFEEGSEPAEDEFFLLLSGLLSWLNRSKRWLLLSYRTLNINNNGGLGEVLLVFLLPSLNDIC